MENQTPENIPEDVPNPQEMDQQHQQNKAELQELKTQELPDDIKWITHEAVSESDQLELLRAYKSGDKEKFDEKYKDVRNSKLLDFAVELAPNLIPGGVIAKGAKLIAAPAIKLASKVAPSAVKAVSSLASNAAGAGKNALSALRSSADMVTGKIAAGAKAVKGATSEAVSAGKELFKPAVEKVTKSIADAKSGFKAGRELSKAEDLGGAGISKSESFGITAGQKLERAKDFIAGTATKAIEKTKQMANNTKDVFSSGIKKAKDVGSNVLERAKTFGGKVTGAIRSAGGAAARVAGTAARVAGSVGRFAGTVARGIVNSAMFLGGGGAGGTSGGTSRGGQGSLSAAGGGVPISAISGGDSGVAGIGSFGGEGAVGSKTALEALNKIHSTLMQMKSTNERMANDISLLVKQSAQKDVSGDLNSANLMARSNVAGGGGEYFGGGYSGAEERGYSGGGGGEMATPTTEAPKAEQSTISKAGSWLGSAVKGGLNLLKGAAGIVAPVAGIGLAAMPSILEKGVGAISEKYESGGRGAGTISSGEGDAGGASYGTHQLSSAKGTLQNFLKSSEYGSQFEGLTPGSQEFNAKWKEVAKTDSKFGEAQQQFIQKTHFDPQMRKLQKAGVDLSGKGRAVQEAIWSTSVQFGGGTSLIQKALAGKDAQTMSDAEIVSAVQDYKLEHNEQLFKSSSANQRAGTLKRAAQEKADLLQVAEMPQTWVGEKSSSKEPGLSSFVKNQGTSSEQIPNLETNQTQTHNLITQKYNISQTEKDKSGYSDEKNAEKLAALNTPEAIAARKQDPDHLAEVERQKSSYYKQTASKVTPLIISESEINKPHLIPSKSEGFMTDVETGEEFLKEELLGERPQDDVGGQMWDIRKAEMEGKTNQPELLGERPQDDVGGQMWDIRKAEMEAKANPNKVEPLGEKPKDDLSGQLWETRKAEMEAKANPNKAGPLAEIQDAFQKFGETKYNMVDEDEDTVRKMQEEFFKENPNAFGAEAFQAPEKIMEGRPSATPIFDESGSSLSSINEAPSVIPAVENEITSGLKGVTDIFSNVGTMISGAVGSIGGGGEKKQAGATPAFSPTNAGHGGNMMSVRNDDPLLLTLQYGNLRTI